MMNEKEDWDIIGYILASPYRRKVLFALEEKTLNPKKISNMVGTHINYVSMLLKGLSQKNIVECVTPHQKKGRIYRLTPYGINILNKIKKMEK